ncbi:AfsR/SARP family transcriptional regulator [Kribbella speibonae]|uniref:SARP family transcriptional regulator n=1 Tax=Kribbella speibonae TaxID=1572660 RepID=A0A4R0ICM4_9ACTN|nr:BTAD domain-containing putative transcriptional regulator [Kribbella speibonae]TCC24684.1 SARP family transcriptional regulator [Kribbella speibonae]TCC30901.1 SARP family transcriptional regulator [Kribbella speibonae]
MRAKPLAADDSDPEVAPAGIHRQVRLRMLDGFWVVDGQQTLSIPLSARRVVAFVALRGRSSRAEVAGTLWPEVSDSKAQACLRTALWRLRQLSPRPLITGDETLRVDESVDVDVNRLITAIRRVINDGECGADQGLLPTLAAMGELLPGWYDDWVLLGRERLRQLQLHALELTAQQLTCSGRYAEAIEAAMAAVRLEPLRESATRVLIEVHLAEDNVVEAIRRLEFFQRSLASEIGVEPTAELVDLVRRRQVGADPRRSVADVLKLDRSRALSPRTTLA